MKTTMNLLFLFIISSISTIHSAEQQKPIIPSFDIPITYKLYFDNAVTVQNIDTIITLLTSEKKDLEDMRNNYPLAMKLYRILNEYTPREDFTPEARYIPIKAITNVAKALAQEGGNDLFLRNMPR